VLWALPNFKGSKATSAQVDDRAVRFTIQKDEQDFTGVAYLPKGEAAPRKLLGSLEARGQRDFMQLERTDLTELDSRKATVDTPGVKALLQKARDAESNKDREAALTEIMEQFSGQPAAYTGALNLLYMKIQNETPEAAVRAHAEKAVQLAAVYGPEMELDATLAVLQML